MLRNLGILLCIVGMPSFLSARGNQAGWENLSTLQPGQKIEVIEVNSNSESGRFSSVTDASITLQKKSGQQTIQKRDVKIVRLMKNKHRLRNTFIGAGVGAGLGAGIGVASYRPCQPPRGYSTCFFDISRGHSVGDLRNDGPRGWRRRRGFVADERNHLPRGRVISSIDHRQGGAWICWIRRTNQK